MKKEWLINLVVFLVIFSGNLYARNFSTYTITNTPEEENISSIINMFAKDYELHAGDRDEAYETYLKAWNPHITDWYHIKTGTKIYIASPSLPLGKGEIPPNRRVVRHEDGIQKYTIKETKLILLLTSSIGDFEETLTSSQDHEHITSQQNSFITLGAAGYANFEKSRDYITGSFYWSKLSASAVSGYLIADTDIPVPSEYGFNGYWARPLGRTDFAYYGGLDFERFGTYNTSQFILHEPLDFNTNRFVYATIGAEQNLFVQGNKLTFKVSLAHTLLSGTSSMDPNDKFTGYRLLLFANYRFFGKYGMHLLYKHHVLTGPSKMQINRFGIGLNMTVF